MTATQSQIRDALDRLHANADYNGCLQDFRTVKSALDTQKPAGDAAQALDDIVTAYCMSLGLNPPVPEPQSQTAEQVRTIKAALNGDCGVGDLVHTVYVVEDDFTHIFSTEKLAKEFADTKECPCVISTYLIDNPKRFYEAVQ